MAHNVEINRAGWLGCGCVAPGAPLSRALVSHMPFTALGGLLGTLALTAWWAIGRPGIMHEVFLASHLLHIVLSASATAAMYRLAGGAGGVRAAILIGLVGAVALGLISDAGLPYLAELALGWNPKHVHPAGVVGLVLAVVSGLAGSILGWLVPATRSLHTMHVMVSVGASMAHLGLAGSDIALTLWAWLAVLGVLFFAVWLPCCVSDVVLPVLVAKRAPRPQHAEE